MPHKVFIGRIIFTRARRMHPTVSGEYRDDYVTSHETKGTNIETERIMHLRRKRNTARQNMMPNGNWNSMTQGNE